MESPKKPQPKASMSPQKSQRSDDELSARPKSPENDSSITSVGRSGRVRKAKVVFDPSDMDIKRRSMPIMEVPKGKRAPKPSTQSPKEVPVKIEKKSDDEDDEDEEFKMVAPISKRRKTISVAALENGCIVCLRADVKKGRFVNCIGCTKRGHFTCLRNDKLFKTADSEKCWQCPSCKICKNCMKSKPNVSNNNVQTFEDLLRKLDDKQFELNFIFIPSFLSLIRINCTSVCCVIIRIICIVSIRCRRISRVSDSPAPNAR